MERALRLAASTNPHPNPRVGAVILDGAGHTVAEGAHQGPGHPHAEAAALEQAGGHLPEGATLVTTLEPCNHHGRTAPCTDAIIAAGVRRVVVGATDPDQQVAGEGLKRLRSAGIEVTEGVMSAAVEAADPAYFHHRRTGRPLYTLKTAVTIDGQTAAADGTSRWITGEEARHDSHLLRAISDAIMVGAGTVRADDPLLTVRLDGEDGHQPTAVVVAGRGPLPPDARLWQRPDTLVVSTENLDLGVENLLVPPGADGLPSLADLSEALAGRGLLSVLMEGGPALGGSLWRAGLIDRGVTYIGARVAGGVGMAMFDGPWETFGASVEVEITSVEKLGEDLRIGWHPVRE